MDVRQPHLPEPVPPRCWWEGGVAAESTDAPNVRSRGLLARRSEQNLDADGRLETGSLPTVPAPHVHFIIANCRRQFKARTAET